MFTTFLVWWAGMLALGCRDVSSSSCAASASTLRLRRACGAAGGLTCLFADIALSTAVKYVAAAYAVVWLLVLLYVWILRSKYQRLEVEVEALEARARRAQRRVTSTSPSGSRVR